MTRDLNLDDIQGNVIRAYGKFGYPKARYFFLNVTNAWVGRRFLSELLPMITTARRWPKGPYGRQGPDITTNVGFTFMGLFVLDVPTRTLQSMPAEFIDGMRKRAFVLGDRPAEATDRLAEPILDGDPEPAWMENWDPIWKENRARFGSKDVHIWISMNAKVKPGTEIPVAALNERTEWLTRTCKGINEAYKKAHGDARGKIEILDATGDRGKYDYQEASAIFTEIETKDGPQLMPTPYEHFGMADGIGDPVFEGQFETDEEAKKVKGRGKWMDPEKGWEPLATGEFLLGHPDESQELPPAARPPEFSKNGTFMAYRKLHENVGSYRAYFKEEAKKFAKSAGTPEDQAEIILRSKFVGRWPDGVPLSNAPTWEAWQEVRNGYGMDDENEEKAYYAGLAYLREDHASNFKFATDIRGYDCPNGSHLRRVNTRDYLDPLNKTDPEVAREANANATTALNKRRRILRRGLPYGSSKLDDGNDETEQGVAMMIICANLFRQFEFVQQQWIQYGLDFHAGNNTCPMLGDHSTHKRFTIPGDPKRGEVPYVCDNLETFVEPRGGEYFFIPSMTALQMIADGVIDPT